MKAPLKWINDYVDISDVSVEELKNKLFSCGFEVEEVIFKGKNIDKIVVCKIEKIEKHPNADKLSVCQIDAGKYGKLQIITAATNVFEGALVPVALDGSTLDNGEKIFCGKLRGMDSFGMFCSGEELGINDSFYKGASTHGILILNENYPLGSEVKEVLGIEEVIFDINVTANRPDCQSILGLAREVAAVLSRPLKMPDLTYKTSGININDKLKVSVLDEELCPKYSASYCYDIKIGESPLWMKKRLFSVGVNSINNIVDITNYVLYEIGQPMHAFDYNYIEKGEIIVRRAENGEKITTLDEKEFSLNNNNLVICDGVKPVALAGIMGGLNSEIKDETAEIVFESAKFKRDNIRKSSRALNQRSDSSSRFEKGVDAYSTGIALKRALNLVCSLGAGKIADGIIDRSAESEEKRVVVTEISRIDKLLGVKVPIEEYKNILTKLNFEIKIDGDKLTCIIPSYRDDIEGYQDIAEEIIRMYGYEHITERLLDNAAITDGGKTTAQNDVDRLKETLVFQGFNEILTYSFFSKKEYEVYGIDITDNEYIKLMNPLGEDFSVMKTTLLPTTVNTVVKNINRKNDCARLFELAKVYIPKSIPLTELPTEKNILSLSVYGENEDFFTLKGAIENIAVYMKYAYALEYRISDKSYLHPTRSADIYANGEYLGYIGELNPVLSEKLGIDKPVYVAEINYDLIAANVGTKIKFSPISKFPKIERDLALIVPEGVSCEQITKCIYSSDDKYLKSVRLFDIYTGNQVENGKKSMAFRLEFVSFERTLAISEIEDIIGKVLYKLKENYEIEIR